MEQEVILRGSEAISFQEPVTPESVELPDGFEDRLALFDLRHGRVLDRSLTMVSRGEVTADPADLIEHPGNLPRIPAHGQREANQETLRFDV